MTPEEEAQAFFKKWIEKIPLEEMLKDVAMRIWEESKYEDVFIFEDPKKETAEET